MGNVSKKLAALAAELGPVEAEVAAALAAYSAANAALEKLGIVMHAALANRQKLLDQVTELLAKGTVVEQAPWVVLDITEAAYKLIERPIKELELFEPTQAVLHREGIFYICDLVSRTDSKLLQLPNFGRHGLNDVKRCLSSRGLKLGMIIGKFLPPKVSA